MIARTLLRGRGQAAGVGPGLVAAPAFTGLRSVAHEAYKVRRPRTVSLPRQITFLPATGPTD